MAILVKICGITSVAAAEAAALEHADFAGLNFHAPSTRNLRIEHAAAIARPLRGRVRIVALLVDPTDELVAAVVKGVAPDFLQLHGRETPARVAALVARYGIPVIKGFGIAEPSDLAKIPAYDDVAEMFLLDAKAPADAATPGGHGVAFDWQLIRGRRFARPWLLAGGLNPRNVAQAVQISEAPGVDVCSGVESAPGEKNTELMAQFVRAARSASRGAAA